MEIDTQHSAHTVHWFKKKKKKRKKKLSKDASWGKTCRFFLLKFALSKLLILSPMCTVQKMLYLARGSTFRDLTAVISTNPFPLLSTIVIKNIRHTWAYMKLLPSFSAFSTRRHCWKGLYTVNMRHLGQK